MNVWDEEAFLRRCRNKPDRAKRLIVMFLEDAPLLLDKIKAEVNAEDFLAIHSSAHSMKGMAANLGALKLTESAAALEVASRDFLGDECVAIYNVIEQEFNMLAPLLRDY